MAITGLLLRCPTDQTKSMTVTAPSAGLTAGTPDLFGDVVGIPYETAAAGVEVAVCIAAHKIALPKETGSGKAITQGDTLYYTDGDTVFKTSGTVKCARVLEAADADDATVLCVFNGDLNA